MTAHVTVAPDDLLAAAADPVEAAREHVQRTALHDGPIRRVGLELEFHLIDLDEPARRPTWNEVQALASAVPPLPSGSSVTLEPGGQIELSTPPTEGIDTSIAALCADRVVLRETLAAAGYGAAALGTDPARPPRRINPSARYRAMERHFFAVGCASPGKAMMTATAALQVNLDAGPAEHWPQRLRRLRDLGPVLIAISACSPLLGGQATGWRSMRQQVWHGIDHRRTGLVDGDDPAAAWASYALDAPIMLVRDLDTDAVEPVTRPIPFSAWLRGAGPCRRPPTVADLDYHLTTLFPPIRPRGYLELRCLDAAPDRWWPALAAVTATLADDPVTADRAAELCEPIRGAWVIAARDGLANTALHRAAFGCVEAASRRCPPSLQADVDRLAELVTAGRTPGDELREHAERSGPLTVLEEEARA